MKDHFQWIKVRFIVLVYILTVSTISTAQILDWSQITSTNATVVEGVFNGFNMDDYSYGTINLQGASIATTDECINCLDYSCNPLLAPSIISGPEFSSMQTKPSVLTESVKLRPRILRFPGGTQTGWYHYYEYGDDIVYDAAAPQIAKGFGMTVGESIFLPSSKSICSRDSRLTVDENHIVGFVNYINNIQDSTNNEYKIEVAYVANLLTHFNFDPVSFFCLETCGRTPALIPMNNYDCTQTFSYSYVGNEALFDNDPDVYRFELYYKETQDAIEYMVDALNLESTDVIYIEMGNEYYNNDGASPGYGISVYGMTVNEYADLAEIYSERLKCYFDGRVNLKTGLVTKSSRTWHETTDMSSPNFPGLVHLMDQDVTADGATLNDVVDAIILHDYYIASDCLIEEDISLRFNCGKEYLNNHIEEEGAFFSEMNVFQADFPGKKVWMTEWNLLGGTDNKNLNYINTPLHAAFVQEYAMSMLEYNASNSNIIEMATHHRIGYDNKWSVIQTEDGDNEAAYVRAAAYPMRYLNLLYEYDNFKFIGNILKDESIEFDTKDAKATAIYQSMDERNLFDRVLIYYTNKTNTKIALHLPSSINGINVENANLSCIKGDELFSYGPSNNTFGKNLFRNNTNSYENNEIDGLGYGLLHNQLQEIEGLTLAVNGLDSLEANSVGVIVVNLESIETGVEIGMNSAQIQVFPNPTNEVVFVSGYEGRYQIVDVSGRLCRQGIVKDGVPITLSKLNAGIYLLRMNDKIKRIVVE